MAAASPGELRTISDQLLPVRGADLRERLEVLAYLELDGQEGTLDGPAEVRPVLRLHHPDRWKERYRSSRASRAAGPARCRPSPQRTAQDRSRPHSQQARQPPVPPSASSTQSGAGSSVLIAAM